MISHEIICRDREASFGNYVFDVLIDTKLIFQIEHDYRGEDHAMRVPNGRWEATDRLLQGGGGEPLRLNSTGIDMLKKLISADDASHAVK